MTGSPWSALLDPLRAAVGTGLDFVHTHLELFAVEMEQELHRARNLTIQAIAAVLLTFLAAGFLGLALIVFYWDSHRQLVAALVAAFFVILAIVALGVFRRSVAAKPRALRSTLEVLERDRDALRSDR